ncbi:MAG: hypothetical protein LBL39_04340 [Planctomycetaceae bacterium]|nr:hypothetical protein [Planctomycetaceae bacterium]
MSLAKTKTEHSNHLNASVCSRAKPANNTDYGTPPIPIFDSCGTMCGSFMGLVFVESWESF